METLKDDGEDGDAEPAEAQVAGIASDSPAAGIDVSSKQG